MLQTVVAQGWWQTVPYCVGQQQAKLHCPVTLWSPPSGRSPVTDFIPSQWRRAHWARSGLVPTFNPAGQARFGCFHDCCLSENKNSSGDEIANVNFLRQHRTCRGQRPRPLNEFVISTKHLLRYLPVLKWTRPSNPLRTTNGRAHR